MTLSFSRPPQALLAAATAWLAFPSLATATFHPNILFTPASLKAGANPKVNFKLTQQAGEEPISKVTFYFPSGFRLPADASITSGETVGSGSFSTALEPLCSSALQPAFDSTAYERDRTPEEIQAGVWEVWVIDLRAVKVDLVISRLPSGVWRSVAKVPTNPVVCPPLVLASELNPTSSVSHTPIWRNPARPGRYTLRSVFESSMGSTYVVRQRMRITRK